MYKLGDKIPDNFCEDHKQVLKFCMRTDIDKEKLLGIWDKDIVKHFEEEETISFPEALEKYPESESEIDSILDDHVWFYGNIAEIRTPGKHIGRVEHFIQKLIKHINKEEAFWAKYNKLNTSKNEISKSIPQGINGEQNEGNIRNEEVAIQLRARIKEAYEVNGINETIGKDLREIDNKVAYDLSIENNSWIDNFYSLGSYLPGGNENTNLVSFDGNLIYKSNNLQNSNYSILSFLDKIEVHNLLFPETSYIFVGFNGIKPIGNRQPYVEPIYSQNFIKNSVDATIDEISEFMQNLGFEKISESKFLKGNIEVSDLFPRNVIKDEFGNIYVIDAEFKVIHKQGGQMLSPEQEARNLLDSMSAEELSAMKEKFLSAFSELILEENKALESLENERKHLVDKKQKLEQQRGTQEYYKTVVTEESQNIREQIIAIDLKIRNTKNNILALSNGGTIVKVTDAKGVEHLSIPDFTSVDTKFISFDEETILTDALPKYVPIINEDVFRQKGYVFDAIRIGKDTYILSINGYSEGKQTFYVRTSNSVRKTEDYEIGYVLVTLDQLALISDYYYTKAKAVESKRADERNIATEAYYDKLPEATREKHFAQRNFYSALPEKVKKKISQTDWELLTLSEKEAYYKPIKRVQGKRLTSKLDDQHMWVSFHKMYELFIDPTKTQPKPGYANHEVFTYWAKFRDMMNWKIKDIKVQREFISDVYRAALETSFGESNTDNSLKEKFGILVKRQNGSKISLNDINQIKEAWIKINKLYGGLTHIATNDNLKISHTGERLVFASKAAGVYIPDWKTIAVSNKFGYNQFNTIMAHEVAHWIDNSIGSGKGKRFFSDDFESSAGVLASTLRNNMNNKTNSDYINSTKECFARAMELYFAIETFGDDATLVYSYTELDVKRTYFTEEHYVNKDNYYSKIKPLAEAFLAENKWFFKFDIDFNEPPIEPVIIEEEVQLEPTLEELSDSLNGAKQTIEFLKDNEKIEMQDYIDGLQVVVDSMGTL